MIYVRVELWPHGDRERARVMGEAVIHNVGGTRTRGDYEVALSSTSRGKSGGFGRDPQEAAYKELGDKGVYRRAEVKNYPRLSLVMWNLIARAIGNAVNAPALRGRVQRE